jgi:uncharacterized protein
MVTGQQAYPTNGAERVVLLDSLRGFALFGILLANLLSFTGAAFLEPAQLSALPGGSAAPAVEFMLEWLVTGKFYSIFSLLFGIGFALQLGRLESRGEGVALYVRRLLVLLGFGIAHLLLLWMGDILALYALMGLVLILFRRASDRTLLIAALLLWLAPILWATAMVHLGFRPGKPLFDAALATFAGLGIDASKGPLPIWSGGDWLILMKSHLGEIFIRYADLVAQLRPAKVLAMFLLGLWVGRRMLYVRLDEYAPLLRKVAAYGLGIGLPLSAIGAWLVTHPPHGPETSKHIYEAIAYSAGVPTLALGYAAAFALLWRTAARRTLTILAPAGRMALTNYISQTLIQILIFYGVGLGLIGKISNAWIPALAVLIFSAQLFFSRAWLKRFNYGPLEWLWRRLTYGSHRLSPLKAAPA